MGASTSKSNTPRAARFKSQNLTSLPEPLLLQIMSLLDAPGLKHLRLTNKLLKCTADELVTCIKYGIAPDYCSPVQLECGAERWPSIKTIKLLFKGQFSDHIENNSEDLTNAIECLIRAQWIAIEEIYFLHWGRSSPGKYSRINSTRLNISAAHALAACTVSWGRLRKLRMQDVICAQGLDILATHGDFPLLEELDLSCSNFGSKSTLASAALAKLVSRAPKLCKLNVHQCRLGFIRLFEKDLPNLEIINLSRCGIDDRVLSKLNPEKWPGLSTLVLEGNYLSDKGFETLLKKNWKALNNLDLSNIDVRNEHIECLVAATSAGRLPSLTSLGVGGVSGITFEAFTFASWPNLERIVIGGHDFDKDDIVNFISSIQAGRFPSLKSLALTYWKKDFRSMFLSRTWNDIEELTLDSCFRKPEDFAGLAAVAANSFSKLRLLAFKKSRNIYYCIPIDPYIRNQAIETLLHAPWPSLMRVEFKCYEHMPEALRGWKVTKSDCGSRTVMERI